MGSQDSSRGFNGAYSPPDELYYFQPEGRVLVRLQATNPGFTSLQWNGFLMSAICLEKGKGIFGSCAAAGWFHRPREPRSCSVSEARVDLYHGRTASGAAVRAMVTRTDAQGHSSSRPSWMRQSFRPAMSKVMRSQRRRPCEKRQLTLSEWAMSKGSCVWVNWWDRCLSAVARSFRTGHRTGWAVHRISFGLRAEPNPDGSFEI